MCVYAGMGMVCMQINTHTPQLHLSAQMPASPVSEFFPLSKKRPSDVWRPEDRRVGNGPTVQPKLWIVLLLMEVQSYTSWFAEFQTSQPSLLEDNFPSITNYRNACVVLFWNFLRVKPFTSKKSWEHLSSTTNQLIPPKARQQHHWWDVFIKPKIASALPKTNNSLWKMAAGRRSFPFEIQPIFMDELLVSFREGNHSAQSH